MSGVSARTRALAGSIGFFVVGPVLEAGIGPWVITGGFSRGEGALDATSARVAGVLLIAAGVVVVVQCFVTFVRDGIGTPSPLAPTAHLIVRGPYRHVRNPMYVATATIIAGEGLLLAQPILLACAVLYVGALSVLVRRSEQPHMRARFGTEYDEYCAAVPAWLPRLRAWEPGRD